MFDYIGMYKHFGYIGENLKVNIVLFPDFAKMPSVCHPHPDKMTHCAILYARLYRQNLSGYWYGRQ